MRHVGRTTLRLAVDAARPRVWCLLPTAVAVAVAAAAVAQYACVFTQPVHTRPAGTAHADLAVGAPMMGEAHDGHAVARLCVLEVPGSTLQHPWS